MDNKHLINFAHAKNSLDFTKAVNGILADKLSQKISSMHPNIASQLFNKGYTPKSGDEQNFVDKHTIAVVDYPVENKDGLPFRDDSLNTRTAKENDPASYDRGEDEKVYEESENLDERKLTKPEMNKREEIAKAIERKFPKMDMQKKMAIATAQAKKSA